MMEHITSYPDIVIREDRFPYVEAKQIIPTLNDWWTHDRRQKYDDLSNYSLDESLSNSLGSSFTHKLINGNFAFVYHKDVLVIFGGLQVKGDECWMHRLSGNPDAHLQHMGIVGSVLMPFQIKTALELGCKTYKISLGDNHYTWYKYWKEKTYTKSKLVKYTKGLELFSQFEYVGKELVNYADQWVLKLDLTRPDIEQFTKF